jgi:hypothetical protein
MIDRSNAKQAADDRRDWYCFEDFVDSEFSPTIAAYLVDVEPKKVLELLDRVASFERVIDQVNAALNRAGYVVAIPFWEAIDELAAARPIRSGARCTKCHYTAPNLINGCARCNPERLGERLLESLEENTKLREQVTNLEDRLREIRSKV